MKAGGERHAPTINDLNLKKGKKTSPAGAEANYMPHREW